MRLWPRLHELARSRTPVQLTRVQIVYLGAFTVHSEHGPTAVRIDLAWSAKSETVFTEDGRVWSHRDVTGPAIDRLIVDAEASPLREFGDLAISYPVCLGTKRGTLSTTAPGQVRELLPA